MVDGALLGSLRLEPLDRKRHARATFSSGVPQVDAFLKTRAAGLQDLDASQCVVACLPLPEGQAEAEIVGYYALNNHGILTASLPEAVRKKYGRHDHVSAIFLSMVGVHEAYQGQGVGSFLLSHALRRCVAVADLSGSAFVVLDALSEDATRLYRRLGFVDLPGHEPRMLISMMAVRAAVWKASATSRAV